MTENARRGFVPEDAVWFTGEHLKTLQKAAGQVTWLLDQGYEIKQSVRFVGDHLQLSARQRMALTRSLAPSSLIWRRRTTRLSTQDLAGQNVLVDGFNTIITMETAFSRGTLIRGRDGCVRDLAGLHGTYHIIPETEQALLLIMGHLKEAGVKVALFLLNRQISNSGRLKDLIEDIGSHVGIYISAAVLDDPDREMFGRPCVITTDSVLIDRCESWYALTTAAAPKTGTKEVLIYTGLPPEPARTLDAEDGRAGGENGTEPERRFQ